MRPIHWVRSTWGTHPALVLSTQDRIRVNPLITVIPGQSAEGPPLVSQMILGSDVGLDHLTFFAVDEVISIPVGILADEIGVLGLDREAELLEKLTGAWGLLRPDQFPTYW